MDRQVKLLVVDDRDDMRHAVQIALQPFGYEFRFAENGRVGLTSAFSENPDLIILDLDLPEMTGYEVCSRLKSSLVTRHIPILILTAEEGPEALVTALEAGADDYVRKPFHPKELQARVSTLLRRTQRYMGTDSLTKLPGNALLREELAKRLESGDPTAVCYVDLDHFKAYVDTYGFEPASRVIQWTARILYNQMVEHGSPNDYIGHIGGDDFVVITTADHAAAVCDGIIASFEEQRERFYEPDDFAKGYLHGLDRDGLERDFPLMTVTIAVLRPDLRDIRDMNALATEAARAKARLKLKDGSNWEVFDGE